MTFNLITPLSLLGAPKVKNKMVITVSTSMNVTRTHVSMTVLVITRITDSIALAQKDGEELSVRCKSYPMPIRN